MAEQGEGGRRPEWDEGTWSARGEMRTLPAPLLALSRDLRLLPEAPWGASSASAGLTSPPAGLGDSVLIDGTRV